MPELSDRDALALDRLIRHSGFVILRRQRSLTQNLPQEELHRLDDRLIAYVRLVTAETRRIIARGEPKPEPRHRGKRPSYARQKHIWGK